MPASCRRPGIAALLFGLAAAPGAAALAGKPAAPAGAPGKRHWAYVKPVPPPLPRVRNAAWPRNEIDRFILARLEREGLQPSPEADPYTLIRRVSLDLTGLPPGPEDVEAFVSEYEAWQRSHGVDHGPRTTDHRSRTGAGTEVNQPSRQLGAVGASTRSSVVRGPWSEARQAVGRDNRPDPYDTLVDRLLNSPHFGERWARPWLDLARYADSHGFQRDDLRVLWPYRDWVIDALNRDMPFDQFTVEQLAGDLLPNATQSQIVATGFHRSAPTNVEAGSEPEETRVNQVIDRVKTTATVWLGTTLECAQCHDHKYDPFSQREYYRFFAFFNNTALEADRADPKVPGSIRFLGPTYTVPDLKDEGGKPVSTLVMQELPRPRPARVFRRGDYLQPGDEVVPSTPAVLHAPPVRASSSGPPTRLTLARWLVSPDNPLVARVTVNRWWMELFGRGLVPTPDDFGTRGEPPTHPELLDYLAVRFVSGDGARGSHSSAKPWSMKSLLRLIVTSATYRQASRVPAGLRERDPENRLYARGPRFRLDAETIRDNALAASGLLSRKMGGPPVRPYQPPGLWTKIGGDPVQYVVSPGEDRYRRGIYTVWKRGAPYPSFLNFDASSRFTCTVARRRTNTPLQALTLLNDPAFVEAAMALARRVLEEQPGVDVDARLRHAFRLCLVRLPRPAEVDTLRRLYQGQLAAARAEPARAAALTEGYRRPEGVSQEELAAWYAVGAALLNLDEAITKG